MTAYFDYRFKFADLSRALLGFAPLRVAGILPLDGIPQNMLGDPRDATGAYTTDPEKIAWIGRKGTAASSYTDENGQTVNVPAVGDPTLFYVAIRSDVPPDKIGVDPADFGLEVCDPAESAAVLGVWA